MILFSVDGVSEIYISREGTDLSPSSSALSLLSPDWVLSSGSALKLVLNGWAVPPQRSDLFEGKFVVDAVLTDGASGNRRGKACLKRARACQRRALACNGPEFVVSSPVLYSKVLVIQDTTYTICVINIHAVSPSS